MTPPRRGARSCRSRRYALRATPPPRSLGALAAELPEAVGREVLALEAQIYGSAPGDWQGDGLRALLPELEKLAGVDEQAKNEPLLPLYR